jgi:hypothetical protein
MSQFKMAKMSTVAEVVLLVRRNEIVALLPLLP